MSTTASLGVTGPGYNLAKTRELSELQLKHPDQPSFHDSHRDSCYIFIGGLNNRMNEGDVVVVFSQWGQVVDVKLVRDRQTGEQKGFGFLAYEDQRSTDLAVDNANGMRLLGRTLRVDHVKEYVVFQETAAGEGEQPGDARGSGSLSTFQAYEARKRQVKSDVKKEMFVGE